MRWWIKMLAALILLVVLAWLGWSLMSGMLKMIGGADLSSGEPDPMFAQEMEIPTRPPELDEETSVPNRPTLDDYIMEEGAPVDKTADELIREARENS